MGDELKREQFKTEVFAIKTPTPLALGSHVAVCDIGDDERTIRLFSDALFPELYSGKLRLIGVGVVLHIIRHEQLYAGWQWYDEWVGELVLYWRETEC